MKKVVRSVWICALSGLAFIAACTTQNGLTCAERRQLIKDKKALIEKINQVESEMVDGENDLKLLRMQRAYYVQLAGINKRLNGVDDTISMNKWMAIDSIMCGGPVEVLYGGPVIE